MRKMHRKKGKPIIENNHTRLNKGVHNYKKSNEFTQELPNQKPNARFRKEAHDLEI